MAKKQIKETDSVAATQHRSKRRSAAQPPAAGDQPGPLSSDQKRDARSKIHPKAGGGATSGGGISTDRVGNASNPVRRTNTKRATLIELLERPEGASVEEIGNQLGWLPHTVRAAISGLRQSGHSLSRNKVEDGGGSRYRITLSESADA